MHTEASSSDLTAPLLFRSATPRISSPEISGAYDPLLKLWAIGHGDGKRPIIEADDGALVEIVTKTKVRAEEDDDDELRGLTPSLTASVLVETLTKTQYQVEADDDIFEIGAEASPRHIAELMTKTDIQQESDDQLEASAGLLELRTKTEVTHEQDDDHIGLDMLELVTKTLQNTERDDDEPIAF